MKVDPRELRNRRLVCANAKCEKPLGLHYCVHTASGFRFCRPCGRRFNLAAGQANRGPCRMVSEVPSEQSW